MEILVAKQSCFFFYDSRHSFDQARLRGRILISFAAVKFSAGVKFSPHHLLAEYNEEELGIKGLVDVFF